MGSRLMSVNTVAALAACGLASACFGSTGSAGSVSVSAASVPENHIVATGQGTGDPYYPDDGNRGYDARHYHVTLDYFRPTQRIAATTTMRAMSTARLKTFHLDLIGMTVTKVEVNSVPATFTRTDAHELVITPRHAIASGQPFVTAVTYRGKPGVDPVGAVPSGWYDATTHGAGFIAGEPHSCTLWYPCNDHPTDKATFELTATVPRPFSVISNGEQLKTTAGTRHGERVRTFHWKLDEATATYLTTIYIDKLTFERSTLEDGTPVVSAYGPHPGSAAHREAKLPQMLNMLARHWGPYPAPQAGGIFVSGDVPFSLETYTRPIYTEGADIETIVHENAHQWWGDNVSVKRWADICLNECLASYSQWLWEEHQGTDLDQKYSEGVQGAPAFFDAPLYDMGAGHEFDYDGVYLKGAYFVHALRNKIGDHEFFTAMQDIQAEKAGGNMSMIDLRDSLQELTGVGLMSFWREWVLQTGVPDDAELYPGDLEPAP